MNGKVNGWRYGCVKRVTHSHECGVEEWFSVHEVYDGGETWTEGPVTFEAESVESLIGQLENAIKDLKNHPVIEDKGTE